LFINILFFEVEIIFSFSKIYLKDGVYSVRFANSSFCIELFFIPNLFLGFSLKHLLIVSRSNTEFKTPKALSKPIVPSLAVENSTFLCSISIGLWSDVIISIVPSFNPANKAFVSLEVLKGGFTFLF
jgi:hypothetical protein